MPDDAPVGMLAEVKFEVPVRAFDELEAELHVECAGIFAHGLTDELDQRDADLTCLFEQMLHERSAQTPATPTEVLIDQHVLDVTNALAPVVADLEQRNRDQTVSRDLTNDTDPCSSRIHEMRLVNTCRFGDRTGTQQIVPALVEKCEAIREFRRIAVRDQVGLIHTKLLWVE